MSKKLLVTGPDRKILQVAGPAGQSNSLSSALVLALTSFHSSFYFYAFLLTLHDLRQNTKKGYNNRQLPVAAMFQSSCLRFYTRSFSSSTVFKPESSWFHDLDLCLSYPFS